MFLVNTRFKILFLCSFWLLVAGLGFGEISAGDVKKTMQYSEIAATPFKDLIQDYPLIEKRVPEYLRKLPWAGLYRYTTFKREELEAADRHIEELGYKLPGKPGDIARGMKIKIPDAIRQYNTALVAFNDKNLKEVKELLQKNDDDKLIIQWFLNRDDQHPEFVRELIDFWKDPEHDWYREGDKITHDIAKLLFWNPYYKFHFDRHIPIVSSMMLSLPLKDKIRSAIAHHYLKLALKEMKERKNGR